MEEQVQVEVMPAEIAAVAKREGLAEETSKSLGMRFAPFQAQIASAIEAARGVTDGANPAHQKVARACRLELRRVRCDIENARKEAKADALRYGKAVDGMANVLKYLCEPEENRLEGIEKYAERIEAARVAQLVADRAAAMNAVGVDPAMYNLAAMDDATFGAAIETGKKIIAEREEAERILEAERVAREKAEAEERARVRADNERLKAEAEAREKAAAIERKQLEAERIRVETERAKERAKAEAAVKAERLAREKAVAEAAAIKAKIEAEAKAKAEAEREAAAAPDREKIESFAATVSALTVPDMATDGGRKVAADVQAKISSFSAWISAQARAL